MYEMQSVSSKRKNIFLLTENSMYLVYSCQWLKVIVLAEVQHQGEQTENLSVETELQEEPVVVFSHTVIDPGSK